MDIVTKLLANFVWNGKKPKIKRETLIGPKEKGGLDLPEYETIIKSLLCAWVKRMKDGAQNDWMTIPSFYVEKVGGTLIFDCSYDLDLLELNSMPAFYIDILKSWAEVQDLVGNQQERSNVREFIIWNNKNITIAGKSLHWRDWHAAGILRIKDLLDENDKFLSYSKLCRKFGLKMPFTNLWRLISAIPHQWKETLRSTNNTNYQKVEGKIYPTVELTCKR